MARIYQESGLAWLKRQAEVAEDLVAERQGASKRCRQLFFVFPCLQLAIPPVPSRWPLALCCLHELIYTERSIEQKPINHV